MPMKIKPKKLDPDKARAYAVRLMDTAVVEAVPSAYEGLARDMARDIFDTVSEIIESNETTADRARAHASEVLYASLRAELLALLLVGAYDDTSHQGLASGAAVKLKQLAADLAQRMEKPVNRALKDKKLAPAIRAANADTAARLAALREEEENEDDDDEDA